MIDDMPSRAGDALARTLTHAARWRPAPEDMLDLSRITRVLEALGNPHQAMPPAIHIAGTNGKGSTLAFLRAGLEADGRRVHTYTSPHLVSFRERIRLGSYPKGRLADEAEIVAAMEHVMSVNADAPLSFFEVATAAAFLLFAEHPADAVLLETGLGGRLDATNVVAPVLSVITPIAMDHRDFLGSTLEAIAGEKAGIVKPGVTVVSAEQRDEALRPIERAAARARAQLVLGGRDWAVREEQGRLVYEDEKGLVDLPQPRLPGRHQHQNAGLAVAALRQLTKVPVPGSAALERGVASASWPARLQRLGEGDLAALVGPGELWLDGGHNPHAAAALAASLAEMEERLARPLVLVCGMLNTKDPRAFLERFQGLSRRIVAVPVHGTEAGIPAETLAAIATSLGFEASAEADLADAIRRAAKADPAPRVLVCGSLYLAGEALGRNGTPPD